MMRSQICESVDQLVWFGDSWPAGVPGTRDQAFPALVGNNLDVSSLNFSIGGTSIPGMIFQFEQWKNNAYDPDKHYVLIACLTNNNRFLWKKDQDWFTVMPGNADQTNVSDFYRYSYDSEIIDFYNQCSIGYLKNLCDELSVTLYFLSNFENIAEDLKNQALTDRGLLQLLLDDPKIVWKNKKQILDANTQWLTDCGHPTADGHKKIADVLTDKLRLIIDKTS
jgi:hypothetical protein